MITFRLDRETGRAGAVSRSVLAAVLAIVFLVPMGLQGQRGQTNVDGLSREEMMARIRAQFDTQMAQDLNLTPEQRTALAEVMQSFAAARDEIQPRRAQLARDMRAYYQNPGSQDEARRLILEARSLRERETELMHEEEERLLEILDPSQVLLMQFLRDQFGGRIRSLGGRDGGPPFGARNGSPPAGR